MSRRSVWYIVGGLGAGVILGVAWGIFYPKTSDAPTVNQNQLTNTNASQTNTSANTNRASSVTEPFRTDDLPDRDPAFSFTADIPSAWAVEYVDGSQAINIYDPMGSGGSSLANAKIFMKYFRASSFETLTTVDIISQTSTTMNGRPAVTYVIKKKSAVPDFPSQPSWRNDQHRVTDIRTTDASPTIFYVVAKAPDVSEAVFEAFLLSLQFSTSQ